MASRGPKSVHMTATGTAVTGAARLRGYQFLTGGVAGDIIFRDGGASGAVIHQFNISTNAVPVYTLLPDPGIMFETDLHVTLPASASVTAIYETFN